MGEDVSNLKAQLGELISRADLVRGEEVRRVISDYQGLVDGHQLRLRPSVGSFSLVSCSDRTPQLGKSRIQSVTQLARALETLQTGVWRLTSPGRPTPEKRLQSWLISCASATGEVAPITDAFGDGARYWFVSDEIALSNPSDANSTPKFVADMLLVKEAADGRAELVNVELKSGRSFDTFDQVETFRKVLKLEDLVGDWRQFAETMTGKKFNWDDAAPSSGIVIWSALATGQATSSVTLEKFAARERIRVLGFYRPTPFSLVLEHPE